MRKNALITQASELFDGDDIAELSSAIAYATEKHTGQKRRSGEPFVTHPIAVARILCDWGMDIDTILAGVLHDTVEDTDATLDQIELLYGRDVAFLVDGVTKVSRARSGMRDINSYLPTTRDNLTKLLIAVGQDVRVIIIKLADRLHNMQTLEYMPRDKQLKVASETLEVFAPLADRLNMGRVRVQLEELAFSYIEPREFKRLNKLMKSRLGRSHRRLVAVRHAVDARLSTDGVEHAMDGRIKSVYSLYKKLRKVPSIDDIYDLIALRIVVADVADCYHVLSVLHDMYSPLPDRFKDYIARPKPNGYQSLHTTIMTSDEQVVEFQIRTDAMHEYAERGMAASFHYNENKLSDAYMRGEVAAMPADLAWIQQLQEVATQMRDGKEADVDLLKVDLFGDRIFVFSPKGDIYDMPEGAFPLDYAYRIHSDIAKQAAGFRVNGKMVSFEDRLKHGDTVEIITKRSAKPKSDWLAFVITSHARAKLKAQLKKAGQ